MMKFGKKFLSWGFVPALLALCGCAASTDSIASVRNFDSKRYLGTWYEIARLPHRFERDLDFVSAHYSEQGDGTIRVVNRGQRDGKEREAVGKAHFKGASDVGELRVSFFGPFYGDCDQLDEEFSLDPLAHASAFEGDSGEVSCADPGVGIRRFRIGISETEITERCLRRGPGTWSDSHGDRSAVFPAEGF